MREVNARIMVREVKSEYNGHELEMNSLLCVDDAVLIADSAEGLQRLFNVFGEVCCRRKPK